MAPMFVFVSILTLYVMSVLSLDTNITFSNEWIVKTNLSEEVLARYATRHGFDVVRKLIDDKYLLVHKHTPKSSRKRTNLVSKSLTDENGIVFAEQLVWRQRSLRASAFVVDDAKWSNMWYINRNANPSMNVLEAWKSGYTGDGVTIAIVDDGVDYRHPDLQGKYDGGLSEDFYDYDRTPLPSGGQSHGTKCAGIATAERNNICVIGVAYKARLVAYRMIGPNGATKAAEISALSKTRGIDIFSNSWGGEDRKTYEKPSDDVKRALRNGCKSGRNGKGAIYVFAGGNGGLEDNCNCDGFVNSIYTIAINSVSIDDQPPGYAEPCSAILASTFSGPGSDSDNICTTDVNNGCIESFTGTSASTPMAAGIVALLLEANFNLTWRDVQELIVRTSKSDGLKYGNFKTNGVGRKVSQWFGYGMLDSHALIKEGLSWKSLSEQHMCTTQANNARTSIKAHVKPREIGGRIFTDGCNQTDHCVNSVEHVEVTVTFQYSRRGAIALTLESPLGTVSDMLTERSGDDARNSQLTWTYMSVQYWGENPVGEWKLNMSIPSDWKQSGTLLRWHVTMYGTGTGCTIKRPKGHTPTKKGPSTETMIAIGTICGAGCIIIACCFVIYFERRRRKRNRNKIKDSNTEMNEQRTDTAEKVKQ